MKLYAGDLVSGGEYAGAENVTMELRIEGQCESNGITTISQVNVSVLDPTNSCNLP